MRKPLRSWTNTLSSLGMKWSDKPRKARRRNPSRLGFEPLEQRQMLSSTQIDNDDGGFSVVGGTWGTVAGGVNGDSRTAEAGTGAVAEWAFTGLTPGQYRMSATWSPPTPASLAGVVAVEAELTQGWPTDGSDSTFAVAQVGTSAVVRSVAGTRDNAETFVVSTPLMLDKLWVEYASRFNNEGFRVALYRVDDPLSASLTTPGSSHPDLLLDDTVAFSEIVGAQPGLTSDADRKYMAIDVDDVELAPGAYALQFFSTGPGRTFKWAEQYGSDVDGDRYESGDRQTDDRNYRFALETAPADGRSTAAPFEIFNGATSLGTVELNQNFRPNDLSDSGTDWEDLGTFVITGTTASVELSSAADAAVIADAIRIERIADLPLTVSLPVPYANEAAGTITGTITRAGSTSGNLVVSLTSSDTSEATLPSTVTILDGNASASFTITLQNDSIFDGTQLVDITATATGYAGGEVALLVTDQGETKIIDNGDTGFTTGGSWTNQSSPTPAGYQTDIHIKSAGAGSATAIWSFSGLTVGTYRVSATWTADTDRATNATYSIYVSSLQVGSIEVDQTTAPASDDVVSGTNFQELGVFDVASGSLSVWLNDLANGKVVADAVRIELVDIPALGIHPSLAMPRDLSGADNQGVAVANLVGQPVDSVALQHALGVAVIATDESHGTLQYSLDNGLTWDDVGSVGGSSSLLLPAAGGRVRLVPDGPFLGTAAEAITFRSWNGTGGNPGDLVDTSTNGVGTAFGARANNLAFELTPDIGTAERLNRFRLYYASTPSLAVAANGDYVAVWDGLGPDGFAIRGQWFSQDGTKLGAEFNASGATLNWDLPNHAVAVVGDNAVVVWSEGIDDPDGGYRILAQLFDREGNDVDVPFDVSDTTPGVQFIAPHAVAHPDGSFVITWQGTDANSISGVFARQYDPAGDPLDAQFLAANASSDRSHSLAATPDGGFAVTGWDNGIVLLRYDDAGTAVGSPIQATTGYVYNPDPALAVDGSGRMIVAWNDGTGAVRARRFASNGTPLGSEIEVAASWTSEFTRPAVATDAEGNFVVAFETHDNGGISQGIVAQWFSDSGSPLYERNLTLAAPSLGGVWEMPSAAANGTGDFVVAWTVRSGDGQSDGIFAQRFRQQHTPTARTIADITIQDPFTLDLSRYFADLDSAYRDSLTYTVELNDAPTIVNASINGTDLTLDQGSAHTAGDADITLRATDATGRYVEKTLTVSVSLTGNAPAVVDSIADVNVDEDAADTVLDLSQVFDDQDLGDTLTYSVTAVWNATAEPFSNVPLSASIAGDTLTLDYSLQQYGTAIVTVRATDSAGFAVEDTFTVTVSPVNDAPILTPLGHTQPLVLSASLVSNTGLLAADLLKDVRDPDNLPSAVSIPAPGLAVTETDETRGTWQYSLDGNVWSNVGSVSVAAALLLPQTARIRFRPSGSALDLLDDGLTFRAWDTSYGAPGTYVDASATGGTTPFSEAADTLSISFNPSPGGESLLATGSIYFSTAAVASDGSSLVAWYESGGPSTGLHAAHFAADGTPKGTPYFVSGAGDFATGADGLGNTLLVWGYGSNVMAQWFDNAGEADGSPVVLQSAAGTYGFGLSVAADGSFVLVWNKYAGNTQVWGQQFNADGTTNGSAFMVNSDTSRNYSVGMMGYQSVAIDGTGGFVVAFSGTDDFSEYTTYVRRFESNGDPVDDQVQAGNVTDHWNGGASVGADLLGNFVVVWQGTDDAGHLGQTMARRFDADMAPQGNEFVASSGTNGWLGSVAMNPQGQFVVTWYGQAANNDEDGIGARFYDAAGAPMGAPVLLNDEHGIVHAISWTTLAAGHSGQFIAAWTDNDLGQPGLNSLYARRLQLPQAPQAVQDINNLPSVDEDAPPTEIDLDAAFSDADLLYRDQLTYEVVANNNETLVTPTIDGGTLILTYAANQSGSATLIIRATDQFGYEDESTFNVTVDQVNDAPTGGPIPGVLLTGSETFSIDVRSYFTDVEDAQEDLVFSLPNSTPSLLASLSLINGVLSGTAGTSIGSAVVTIRGADRRSRASPTTSAVNCAA